MDDVSAVADGMWAVAREHEQCARRVPSDEAAARIRARLRQLAARDRIRIRTARVDDTVVVVRLDAKVWHESAASMRSKLTPER